MSVPLTLWTHLDPPPPPAEEDEDPDQHDEESLWGWEERALSQLESAPHTGTVDQHTTGNATKHAGQVADDLTNTLVEH